MPAPYFVAASTGTAVNSSNVTLNINKPTGVVSGDILIAVIVIENNGVIVTVPSGWTQIYTWAGTARTYLYRKTAGGSEPSNYTWAPASNYNGGMLGAISAWRDAVWDASTTASSSGTLSTSFDCPSVTASVDNCRIIPLAVAFSSGDISGAVINPASGTAEVYDTQFRSMVNEGASKTQTMAGASGAFTVTRSGTGATLMWRTFTISLKGTNSPPNTPTTLQRTGLETDTTPNFSCDVSDPNAGEQIKARFEVQTAAGAAIGTVDSAFRTGNGTVTAEYSSALAIGTYRVRSKSIDDDAAESANTGWVSFSVLTSVEEDTNFLWNVKAVTDEDIQLIWNVEEENTVDLEVVWNTYQSTEDNIQFGWSVLTPWQEVVEDTDIWTQVVHA